MSLLQKTKETYNKVKEAYVLVVQNNMELDNLINSGEIAMLSESDQVDVGFLLREIEELQEELRKEVLARRESLEKVIAYTVSNNLLTMVGDGVGEGTLAKAYISAKPIPTLPKTGTEEYNNLCRQLGFSEKAISLKLAKLHWKNLQDYASLQAAEGRHIEGLRISTKPAVTFRRKD